MKSSFEKEFSVLLSETSQTTQAQTPAEIRWVIVFSPTGCEAMLRSLGLLDPTTGRAIFGRRDVEGQKTYVASIGPTTRDYLKEEFGFEVDVCAERPSPEGVRDGIWRFMEREGS